MSEIYSIVKPSEIDEELIQYAKLWYADDTILFESIEEASEFMQQFPVFFEGIECEIMETRDLIQIQNGIFYDELINDEVFLYHKNNMIPKYVIKNSEGMMASINNHIILFDNEDEVTEFMSIATELFPNGDYEIIDETSELIWNFYIDYNRLTPSTHDDIEESDITS